MNENQDIRGFLAVLILVGGGYLLTQSDTELRLAVVSIISTVVGYYFGSSQSNKDNRATIDKMVNAQNDTAKALAEKVATPPPPTQPPQPVKIVNEPVDVSVVRSETHAAETAPLP